MYLWFATAWTYLALTYPIIWRAKYLHNRNRVSERDKLANIIILRFAKLMFYITGSRLRITGRENIPKDEPVLFVSNHLGHMDSLIIQGFIKKPKGFVTIIEYQKQPILSTWMKYMGCVFIDRDNPRQSLLCINEAIDNLNNGQSMVVFPEGRLNDGGKTLEFKKGWLRIALKSGVPIVPITLKNSHRIVSYNGKKVHPSKVECIISAPIETKNIKKVDEWEFVQKIKNIILENYIKG